MFRRIAFCFVLASSTAGCSAFEFRTDSGLAMQKAITGLIAVDTGQTYVIADNPGCLHEINPVAYFGNEHPRPKEVLITNAVYGIGHWLLGAWIDRNDWPRAQKIYWALTSGGHSIAVKNNMDLGIVPFQRFSCGQNSFKK